MCLHRYAMTHLLFILLLLLLLIIIIIIIISSSIIIIIIIINIIIIYIIIIIIFVIVIIIPAEARPDRREGRCKAISRSALAIRSTAVETGKSGGRERDR